MKRSTIPFLAGALVAPAFAQTVVTNYDDLSEGFYGNEYTHNGVTYHSVNNVPGVFPDGGTFEPGGDVFGLGDTIMVENAALLYNDFPGWGSPNNVLTFGSAYIPGDNLSLGALSTMSMDINGVADSASFDMGYYENGPWGGISFHLEAMMGGSVVASDSFVISDLGGRDNIAFAQLSVDGALFDSLRVFATYGDDYSGPRFIMDDLTINYIPAPGSLALLGMGGLMARRRR